jgi:plasmid stabilization system protein ParE
MTIRRSPRAAVEIRDIATYLAQHSRPAAQRFLEALAQAQQQLSQFPNSGAPGPLPGTRRLIVGNYVVSYRRRGSDVEIYAVRHARQRDAPGTGDNILTCSGLTTIRGHRQQPEASGRRSPLGEPLIRHHRRRARAAPPGGSYSTAWLTFAIEAGRAGRARIRPSPVLTARLHGIYLCICQSLPAEFDAENGKDFYEQP